MVCRKGFRTGNRRRICQEQKTSAEVENGSVSMENIIRAMTVEARTILTRGIKTGVKLIL